MFALINEIMSKIKNDKPLILNITNDVTINFVANGLLSIGASPVMSKSVEEMEDLLHIAKSLVINIGTLNKNFVTLCERACEIAQRLNKPIILDPVGAGASTYRTKTCQHFIKKFPIAIIRGNASEVMALSNVPSTTKGVDSTRNSEDAITAAQLLSKSTNSNIVISGKIDVVIDHDRAEQFTCGSSLMPTITGTGCLLTAVVAAFHCVHQNRFEASCAATLFYGVCGEIAEKNAHGPGSFKTHFLDALNFLPQRDHYEKK